MTSLNLLKLISDKIIHNHRSIRLKEYDYSQTGAYFVTIYIKNHECLFGNISNDQMILNEYGEITKKCWFNLPNHYINAQLGDFVIMLNHFHGIIRMSVPTTINGLSEIVRALKIFSSRIINEICLSKRVGF